MPEAAIEAIAMIRETERGGEKRREGKAIEGPLEGLWLVTRWHKHCPWLHKHEISTIDPISRFFLKSRPKWSWRTHCWLHCGWDFFKKILINEDCFTIIEAFSPPNSHGGPLEHSLLPFPPSDTLPSPSLLIRGPSRGYGVPEASAIFRRLRQATTSLWRHRPLFPFTLLSFPHQYSDSCISNILFCHQYGLECPKLPDSENHGASTNKKAPWCVGSPRFQF